jgi:predicted murein hydrolase (TIGR00659 family)
VSPTSLSTALWIALACAGTIALYAASRALHARTRSVLTLPIVITAGILFCAVVLGRLDLDRYEAATRPLSFWLGPATVALAVPLHRQRALVGKHLRAVVASIVVGSISSMLLILGLSMALHLARPLTLSLVPKSVTTPIAMPIAEQLGGIPAVAAAIVVITGVLGMAFGGPLLTLARVRHPIARGLALGTGAHGIGTARALEEGPVEGAMSGVAMVISGVVTALLAPAIVRGLGGLLG